MEDQVKAFRGHKLLSFVQTLRNVLFESLVLCQIENLFTIKPWFCLKHCYNFNILMYIH